VIRLVHDYLRTLFSQGIGNSATGFQRYVALVGNPASQNNNL
jgi:hypothetical protein